MEKLRKINACILDLLEFSNMPKENNAETKMKKIELVSELEKAMLTPNDAFNSDTRDLLMLKLGERIETYVK